MFEPRKYSNHVADSTYEDMLDLYLAGGLSEARMAEFAAMSDEIEAEHLAKQAEMDAKKQRKPANTTKKIAA